MIKNFFNKLFKDQTYKKFEHRSIVYIIQNNNEGLLILSKQLEEFIYVCENLWSKRKLKKYKNLLSEIQDIL